MPDHDRRTLVKTLAGVSLGSTIAGCTGGDSGGDGGDGTGSDGGDSPDGSFGVSDLVFVAEKPAGYMEYEEQPDATYEPGEVVWLYYNLDDVATEAAGEGEVRIRLSQDISVFGPSGDVLLEDENDVEQAMAEDASTDELFFYNNVSIPGDAAGGEYEIAFELTDEVAGETVSETATFVVDAPAQEVSAEGQFGVSNGVFLAEQPTAYMEYVEQPDATYRQGEVVWYYVNVDGVSARRGDSGEYETSLTQELTVTDPDGGTVLDDTYETSIAVEEVSGLEEYFFVNDIRLPDDASTGRYELSFELADEVAGEAVSHTATFAVESAVVDTERAFDVAEFVFCATEPAGYDDYEPQPDATYAPSDDVWMYVDIVGVGYRRTSEGRLVRVVEDITVSGSEGGVVFEDSKQYENTFPADLDLETYFIQDGLTTGTGTPPGTYTVEIELEDAHTKNTTTTTGQFDIQG